MIDARKFLESLTAERDPETPSHDGNWMHEPTAPKTTSVSEPLYRPPDLPVEWWQRWDERAAIMEYDGNLPRERAEALALDDILRQMELAGIGFSPNNAEDQFP